MPELKPLPCPACGSLAKTDDGHDGQRLVYWVKCCECEMCGPMSRADAPAAINLWNSLTRALTWGEEPPKVAGWYFFRQPGESFDLIRHYHQKLIDGGFDDSKGNQWAGPIAPPRE